MSRLLKLSSWSRTGVTQSGSAGAADAPGAARMTPAPLAVRTRAPMAAPTRRIIKRSPRVALGDRLARQVDGRPHVADGAGDMDYMLGVRKRHPRVLASSHDCVSQEDRSAYKPARLSNDQNLWTALGLVTGTGAPSRG